MNILEKLMGLVSPEEFEDAQQGAANIFRPYANDFLNLAEKYMEAGRTRNQAATDAYLEIKDHLYVMRDESPEGMEAYRDFCNISAALGKRELYELAEDVMVQAQKAEKATKQAPKPQYTPEQMEAFRQAYNQAMSEH
jgi:hypothetical protein